MIIPAAVIAGLVLAVAAPGASAQTRDVQQRLERIERILEGEAFTGMTGRVEQMDQEIRLLRGEVETLRHELEVLRTRQRDLYLDLDGRLEAISTGGSPPVAVPPPEAQPPAAVTPPPAVPPAAVPPAAVPPPGTGTSTAPSAPPPAVVDSAPAADENEAYQTAFNALRDGQHAVAAAQFQAFLRRYPDSPLASNAQYWLAESFYVTREYTQALQGFRAVLDRYPGSNKAPDALLKIGFTYYELGQWTQAREALNEVVSRYPDTSVARLASQRLTRMRQEGR